MPIRSTSLWGGGNDLFDDHSAQSGADTANRVRALIQRLANAGARNLLVPNVRGRNGTTGVALVEAYRLQ